MMRKLITTNLIFVVTAILCSGFIFTDLSSAEEINANNLREKSSFSIVGSSIKNSSIYTDNSPSTLMAKSSLSPLSHNTFNQRPLVTDDWQFILTPYIWFAGLSGDISANGQQVDVSASFGDIFDQLDFAFQIHA
ncbi:MAG: hypothetical protein ACR2NW_06450, partial [Thermodesulfobacteriota bacterium]